MFVIVCVKGQKIFKNRFAFPIWTSKFKCLPAAGDDFLSGG